MSFQISGLPVAPYAPFFGLPDADLAKHGILRHTATEFPGFPCRVSLRDAEPGQTLLLLNYEHLDVATPYRSRYAIYVREYAEEARVAVDEVPDVLRRRLLSLRAFDKRGMLVDCDVAEGRDIEPIIGRLLGQPEVDYIHVHNAKPGCFAARVDRA
ncbi:MAG: DUF1203 domain-containing protein [Sinobacteraceae bacterium]|nr:DUF1203 domain-containing protein [Nevskiaceae bacterium]